MQIVFSVDGEVKAWLGLILLESANGSSILVEAQRNDPIGYLSDFKG